MITFQPDGVAGKDTYISAGSKTSTYGNSTTIEVGGSGTVARTAYMYFDVFSQIPAGSTINSAILSLYHYGGAYDRVFAVKGITTALASWSEMMDYYGQPTVDPTSYAGTAQGTAINVWNSIDIKTLVQRWVNSTLINNGLQLYKTDSSTGVTQYYSSDYNTDPTLRPKLVIDYSEPFIPATKATLQVNAIGPDVSPTQSPEILATPAMISVIASGQKFALCFIDQQGNWQEVSLDGNMTNPVNFGTLRIGEESAPVKLGLKVAKGFGQESLSIIPGGSIPSDLAISSDNNGSPGTWNDWGKSLTLPISSQQEYNTFFVKTRVQSGEKDNIADGNVSIIVRM